MYDEIGRFHAKYDGSVFFPAPWVLNIVQIFKFKYFQIWQVTEPVGTNPQAAGMRQATH